MSWLNTADYSYLQLALCGIGCALWLVSYGIVLLAIRRSGFVEIPAAAVVADLAWEFLWGFVFADTLGRLQRSRAARVPNLGGIASDRERRAA